MDGVHGGESAQEGCARPGSPLAPLRARGGDRAPPLLHCDRLRHCIGRRRRSANPSSARQWVPPHVSAGGAPSRWHARRPAQSQPTTSHLPRPQATIKPRVAKMHLPRAFAGAAGPFPLAGAWFFSLAGCTQVLRRAGRRSAGATDARCQATPPTNDARAAELLARCRVVEPRTSAARMLCSPPICCSLPRRLP